MIKRLINIYIHQYIHVALATTALASISYVYFELPFNYWVLLLVFFSTLLGYHFIRWANVWFNSLNKKDFDQLPSMVFMGLSGIGMLLVIKHLHVYQSMLLFPVGFLTITYAVPFIKIKGKWQSLRQIPQLKILIIALSWTLMTVALPLFEYSNTTDFWIEFIQRFVFIVAVTIPFDIRDFLTDPKDLGTLPQKIGVERSKHTGMLLIVLFFVLTFLMSNLTTYGILSELGVFILVLLFLYYSNPDNDKYFVSFWVEAVPIFWLIDVLIWRLIL